MGQIQLHPSARASAKIARLSGLRANCTLRKKTSAHYKIMPWASGDGSTTELYVSPNGSSLTDASAHWRISMARVEKQEDDFSLLPSYRRIITLVEGQGFRLTGNQGTNIEVTPGVIYHFSGAEKIKSKLLGGPCLDLNFMYQADKVIGSLAFLEQAAPIHASITTRSSKETVILVCLKGQATVRAYGKRDNILLPYDSVCFSSNEGQGRLVLNSQANSKFALVSIVL